MFIIAVQIVALYDKYNNTFHLVYSIWLREYKLIKITYTVQM